MEVRVELSSGLQAYADDRNYLNLDAGNLSVLYRKISEQYPELADKILTDSHQLLSYVSVFVNQANVSGIDPESISLHNHSTVLLLPAIAGG